MNTFADCTYDWESLPQVPLEKRGVEIIHAPTGVELLIPAQAIPKLTLEAAERIMEALGDFLDEFDLTHP